LTYAVGNPKVTSLSVQTEDAGTLVGIGIVFESSAYADRFLQHLLEYFETPGGSSRSFIVYFYDRKSYCDLAIDVTNQSGTMSIDISQVSSKVLEDLVGALSVRPYFFIIACIAEVGGAFQPYRADDSIIYQSRLMVDGKTVSGNRLGGWTRKSNPFAG
jgi:hypothetical protein